MKLSAAALSSLFFVSSSYAQYFSVGWSPGQKVSSPNPQQAATTQSASSTSSPSSFMDKLLSYGPAAALLNTLGLNVSATANQKLWDERIQLITDENYKNVIVNEPLTPQEEKERAWVIIITGQAVKQDEASKLADNVFDTAYEQAQQAGDLPHVRWGRIDYVNVTRITTKWAVWQVPYFVVITNRGQTLRFYRHYQVRLRAENLRDFLKTKEYLLTPPWVSAYAPGGEREYILDHFANILAKVYGIAILFPRWILFIASGTIASFVIALMHKSTKKASKPPKSITGEKKPSHPPAPAPAPILAATVPTDTWNGIVPTSTSTSKPVAKPPADSHKRRSRSPPKPASKTLTPAATDSERESSAKPTKRSSTRPKKTKKT